MCYVVFFGFFGHLSIIISPEAAFTVVIPKGAVQINCPFAYRVLSRSANEVSCVCRILAYLGNRFCAEQGGR